MAKTKTYFVSDFHLGQMGVHSSEEREQRILQLFEQIKEDGKSLFLLGDLFDYWFEYKQVIPLGFERFISGLLALKEAGVAVEIFTGNHDMWMFRYFQSKGIPVHKDPIQIELDSKRFFLGHGDGLGPGDLSYKIIKRFFRSRICQFAFGLLHPNIGIGLMKYFSQRSRKNGKEREAFSSFDKEFLVQFCENYQGAHPIDYFIFGHRHIPIRYKLSKSNGEYINIGDSLVHYTYGVWNDETFTLVSYGDETPRILSNY